MGEEARNGCDEDITNNAQEGRSELVSRNQASQSNIILPRPLSVLLNVFEAVRARCDKARDG